MNIEQEFIDVFSKYKGCFKSWLYTKYKLQDTDQDDIIQATFQKAWQSRESFRGQSKLSTWIYTILKNEAFNLIKARNKKEKREVISISDVSEESFVDMRLVETAENLLIKKEELAELKHLINRALEKIPSRDREILSLFVIDELSYKNVSDKLNIPIGTVMSRLFYAKRRAKEKIIHFSGKEVL